MLSQNTLIPRICTADTLMACVQCMELWGDSIKSKAWLVLYRIKHSWNGASWCSDCSQNIDDSLTSTFGAHWNATISWATQQFMSLWRCKASLIQQAGDSMRRIFEKASMNHTQSFHHSNKAKRKLRPVPTWSLRVPIVVYGLCAT